MRNLRNVHHVVFNVPPGGLPLTATAWDPSTDSVICAFGPTSEHAIIELKRAVLDEAGSDKFAPITSWDAPCPIPDWECDKILNLQYFADTGTACLTLAGGDLVVVREDPLPGEDLIEIVGSIDAGISAAAWSPDEELLALSTRSNTLLYMTRDFESVSNVSYVADDLKLSNHVSVGWGKKETQFKGKRAKELRDPTMPEKVDEGVLSELDDCRVTISWRGDGAFLAVNTIEEDKRRVIRIYSREGLLESVTEPVDGLEGAMSWRPAGNLIAGIQRLKDRIDVVFFERNGLRHGQFSLRLTPDDLSGFARTIDLAWNTDSSVLGVIFQDRVQLWTMGNYHYYLKQEIMLLDSGSEITEVNFVWHPQKSLRVAASRGSSARDLEYTFCTALGPTCSPNDEGVVAVVDGKTLKLSYLRHANMPPPMALHEVLMSLNAIDVAVSPGAADLTVLHENSISIYRRTDLKSFRTEPVLVNTYELSNIADMFPRQTVSLGNDKACVLLSSKSGGKDRLYAVGYATAVSVDLGIPNLRHIRDIFLSVDLGTPFVQLSDGRVFQMNIAEEVIGDSISAEVRQIAKLPSPASCIQVVHRGEKCIAFGLTGSGSLLAYEQSTLARGANISPAERVLSKSCSSVLLTSSHLLFTTHQHLLKFVHLDLVANLEIPADEPEKDERCRCIERGAQLVTVMPTVYSVVLQMPRGNLETIYPRALVLAGIRKSIAAKDYKRAFLACRNQRVDMNILHDHNSEQFLGSVRLFIKQLKKIEHIDLFLSQLRDEDVSKTMYRETMGSSERAELNSGEVGESQLALTTGGSKINRICDAFLLALEGREDTNLQNIITANVCKSPPDLEAGLLVIANLRRQEHDLEERAVEHICFLADANQLYDSALGLYDLDLALLIAQQSQKDPREYLPYLQKLQGMPSSRMKFTIDHDLARRRRALGHLHAIDDFEEFKGYVEKYELHEAALDIYKYQTERLNEIMGLYASYLNGRNRFKEAGIAYEYLKDYASASAAYRAAHMWRESLFSASLIPLTTEQSQELANDLADTLTESKDFAAAATIHLDHLRDVDAATRLLCRGYFFAEAMRLVGLHARIDLLETVVDPGLVEGLGITTELLAECKGQIKAQVPRLRELRAKKSEDPLAFIEGDAAAMDIPDNISLAATDASTTGGTFMTRYTSRSTGTLNTNATRRTSKNRRREERKRASGKKGSVYEEEYLVSSIGRLIERVNSVDGEVRRLIEGLLRRGMRQRAAAVEAAMLEVVDLCAGCVEEVFESRKDENGAERAEGDQPDDAETVGRPPRADGVLWDNFRAKERREVPVMKPFEKLSLLS